MKYTRCRALHSTEASETQLNYIIDRYVEHFVFLTTTVSQSYKTIRKWTKPNPYKHK